MSSTTTIFSEEGEKFATKLQTVTASHAIRFGFANRYGSFGGDALFFVPIGREAEVVEALEDLIRELRKAQKAAELTRASAVVIVTEGTVDRQDF
jgi:hypothetical protein